MTQYIIVNTHVKAHMSRQMPKEVHTIFPKTTISTIAMFVKNHKNKYSQIETHNNC